MAGRALWNTAARRACCPSLWSPLAHGVLRGNLDSPPDNVKETAALVQKYAQGHETTAEAILLAWLLKNPATIQPVLGSTRPDRLRACAKARFCLPEHFGLVLVNLADEPEMHHWRGFDRQRRLAR
jgi:predicted oxidoreductase